MTTLTFSQLCILVLSLGISACSINASIRSLSESKSASGSDSNSNPESLKPVPEISIEDSEPEVWTSDKSTPIILNIIASDWSESDFDIEVSVGTSPGGNDIKDWAITSSSEKFTTESLNLAIGFDYFTNVRVKLKDGRTSSVKSTSAWRLRPDLWVTNGSVSKMIVHENNLFLAGNFTKVGPWTGGFLMYKKSNGETTWKNPSIPLNVGGTIGAVVSDGNGGYFIGGQFNSISGKSIKNLAWIKSNGEVDEDFSFDFTEFSSFSGVYAGALAVQGNKLYVGGTFSKIDGQNRSSVAAIDLTTKSLDSFVLNVNEMFVHKILIHANRLYVANNFTVNSYELSNGTRWTAFVPDTFTPRGLAIIGDHIYIGGWFTSAGANSRNGVLSYSTITGAENTGFNAGLNSSPMVYDLAASGSTLYIAGAFTHSSGAQHLIAVNGNTGARDPAFDPGSINWPADIAIDGSQLYVASYNTLDVRSLTTGALISDDLVSVDSSILSTFVDSDFVVVGGEFRMIPTLDRQYLAAFNLSTGAPVNSFNPHPSHQVYDIAINSGSLYAAGLFTSFGLSVPTSQAYLARMNPTTGAIDTSFAPLILGGAVSKMRIDDDYVYFSGSYTSVAGSSRTGFAAVDKNTGAIHSDFNPVLSPVASVTDFEIYDQKIYFAGNFTQINSVNRNYAAAIDLNTLILDSTFNPNFNSSTIAVEVAPDSVYFSGYFSQVGGLPRARLARVNRSDGALDLTYIPNADPGGGAVGDILLTETGIYLTGNFSSLGGSNRRYIGKFDLTTGILDLTNLLIGGDFFNSMYRHGDFLYLSSDKPSNNTNCVKRISVFDLNTGACVK